MLHRSENRSERQEKGRATMQRRQPFRHGTRDEGGAGLADLVPLALALWLGALTAGAAVSHTHLASLASGTDVTLPAPVLAAAYAGIG